MAFPLVPFLFIITNLLTHLLQTSVNNRIVLIGHSLRNLFNHSMQIGLWNVYIIKCFFYFEIIWKVKCVKNTHPLISKKIEFKLRNVVTVFFERAFRPIQTIGKFSYWVKNYLNLISPKNCCFVFSISLKEEKYMGIKIARSKNLWPKKFRIE